MPYLRARNFFPRSLFGRSILILIVPIIVIQLVVGFIFLDRLFGDVTRTKTAEIAREITYILGLGPEQTAALAALEIEIREQSPEFTQDSKLFYDISGGHITAKLRDAFDQVDYVVLDAVEDWVLLGLTTDQGPIEIRYARSRSSAPNPHQLLVAMTLASLIMTAIALIFLRNQIKPIRLLAFAAEAFGKGRNVSFSPRGASEVRVAGHAFRAMKERIERHIEQRTLILSGVSHDLRTPLTRLKLGLSMLEPRDEAQPLEQDVDEMEAILDEFLDFARGDSGEDPEPVDILQFSKDLIDDHARAGQKIELVLDGQTNPAPFITVRKTALGRALGNLLGNASRFGKTIRMSVDVQTKSVVFCIEDDGPGIPEDQRDEALKPFSRLDPARNQNKGSGTGLGLSITSDIAKSHGGQLTLSESKNLGGLSAELRLPR